MAYYQYERALEDVLEFADVAFLADVGRDTRDDSARWLMAQFGPHGSVASAQGWWKKVLSVNSLPTAELPPPVTKL